uniref:6-cysteine protein n=1 Tax=Strongyloides papillosus TaxID=174720 RepID=A0A0N5B379_STREA
MFNKNTNSNLTDITHYFLPKEYNDGNSKFKRIEEFLTCNIFKCHIGIVYHCNPFTSNCSDTYEAANFFYIEFEKSSEYDNLVMKLITKNNNNTYMFSVVVCPSTTWLLPSSNSEYIPTGENSITKLVSNDSTREYPVKFVYCHEIGVNTFTKCGYLKQMFMPRIDVGYQCDEYNEEETKRIHNKYVNESFMIPLSSGGLTCNDVDIYGSSSFVIGVLPPGNNYHNVSDFKVNVVNNRTNLYFGHRLHSLNVSEVYEHYEEAELYLGYAIHYEAKCKIPSLNATLRLNINGTIQEFKNKTEDNLGGMNIYTFDRRKIKDAPIGCHAVPDEIKHPALNDYYKLLYSTSLLMFDEAAQKYIKVDDSQKLVSNSKYKCILNMKSNNSEIDKPNFIKETEFSINLTYENSNNATIPTMSYEFSSSTGSNINTVSNNSTGSKNSTGFNFTTVSNNSTGSKNSTVSKIIYDFNNSTSFNTSTVSKQSTSSKKSTDSKNFNKSYIWIIFGVSIIVIVLIIIGFVILKKLQLKRKKSNNDSSTSLLASSSQSKAKSPTVISKTPDASIIKKTNSDITCTNMTKTIFTKDSKTSNKVTNFEQPLVSSTSDLTSKTKNPQIRIVTMNSNLDLINQAKNTPKNVVIKSTNQSTIINIEDSVFKI